MTHVLWRLGLAVTLLAASACDKKPSKTRAGSVGSERATECVTAADCGDSTPCTMHQCDDGVCRRTFAARGSSCENGNPCDGLGTCDGAGRCIVTPPPDLDDGNACTVDRCDVARGVIHLPVDVDDGDACTVDACDPKTGAVTHEPIAIDDGDDCTFDSCDPKTGPTHRRIEASYSCDASCGEGFHAASRRKSTECGSREALQTFCAPNCGPSFYSCDASCPAGYRAGPPRPNPQCGERTAPQIFCMKD